MQVKKQQLKLDMEQQTGSKLGKEYFKATSNINREEEGKEKKLKMGKRSHPFSVIVHLSFLDSTCM